MNAPSNEREPKDGAAFTAASVDRAAAEWARPPDPVEEALSRRETESEFGSRGGLDLMQELAQLQQNPLMIVDTETSDLATLARDQIGRAHV